MGSTSPPVAGKLTINLWIPCRLECGVAGEGTPIGEMTAMRICRRRRKKRGRRGPPLILSWTGQSVSLQKRREVFHRYIFRDTTICVSITLLKYKLSFRISKNPENKFVYFFAFADFGVENKANRPRPCCLATVCGCCCRIDAGSRTKIWKEVFWGDSAAGNS